MGILRTDRITGLGGANAITGSVSFETGRNKPIFLKIASDDFAVGTGDFTLECWYYKSGLGTHDDAVGNIIMQTGNQNGQNGIWLADAQGKLEGRVHYGSGSWNLDITSSSSMVNDRWYHVAMSRSGSTVRIFIDGTLEASGSSSSDLTTAYSNEAYIGAQGNSTGNRGIIGFISNARISDTALYTATFTAPTTRLEKLSSTLLLCCQSPGNVLQEATGKTIQTYVNNINVKGPRASRKTPNSPVGFSTTTDVGSQYGSTFDGFGSFATSTYMVPPGGNTRERNRGRGLSMAGATPAISNVITFIEMSSNGQTGDFGDLTQVINSSPGACSSSTRGIVGGGGGPSSPNNLNVMEFVTISNTANAQDFGDLSVARRGIAACGNDTRGLWGGGRSDPSGSNPDDTIDFVTIATLGNASDFGNLSVARRYLGSTSSTTRGFWMGGNSPSASDVIDFITITTTGNAADFGNLTAARSSCEACSSATRAIVIGGFISPAYVNTIDFFTMASSGNATDFGDSTTVSGDSSPCSNSIRGYRVGGGNDSTQMNSIDFVTFSTTGNAQDFGDLPVVQSEGGGCSDSHGGLS